jgi:hypothetical protein
VKAELRDILIILESTLLRRLKIELTGRLEDEDEEDPRTDEGREKRSLVKGLL